MANWTRGSNNSSPSDLDDVNEQQDCFKGTNSRKWNSIESKENYDCKRFVQNEEIIEVLQPESSEVKEKDNSSVTHLFMKLKRKTKAEALDLENNCYKPVLELLSHSLFSSPDISQNDSILTPRSQQKRKWKLISEKKVKLQYVCDDGSLKSEPKKPLVQVPGPSSYAEIQTNVQLKSKMSELKNELASTKVSFQKVVEEKKKLEEELILISASLNKNERNLQKRIAGHTLIGQSEKHQQQEISSLKEVICQLNKELQKYKKESSNNSSVENNNAGFGDCGEIGAASSVSKKLKHCVTYLKMMLQRQILENAKLVKENELLQSLPEQDEVSNEEKSVNERQKKRIWDLEQRLKDVAQVKKDMEFGGEHEIKVDYASDNYSLCEQLAKFVTLYREVVLKNEHLEEKLKEITEENISLQEYLEDSCSKYETKIKYMEEKESKIEKKIKDFYQRYQQYKAECYLLRRRVVVLSKENWIKNTFRM